ncbi:hypothetical protein GCM10027185_59190 [Spirosoma pulveris]
MMREMELETVPMESAAGTWAPGNWELNMGKSKSPAPPPQTALSEKANRA